MFHRAILYLRHRTNNVRSMASSDRVKSDMDTLFEKFAERYGIDGLFRVAVGCSAVISVSIFLGTYTVNHKIDGLKNDTTFKIAETNLKIDELRNELRNESNQLRNEMNQLSNEMRNEMNQLSNEMKAGFVSIQSVLLQERDWHMKQLEKQNKTILDVQKTNAEHTQQINALLASSADKDKSG